MVKSIEFKVWWLSNQSLGSIPCHDTCVLEQDAFLELLLFTQEYKWVPAKVEVYIVYERAFGALGLPKLYILPRKLRKNKEVLLAHKLTTKSITLIKLSQWFFKSINRILFLFVLYLIFSSRSHLLLILNVEGVNKVSNATSYGSLMLVDLAGSERIAKTGATGQTLVEAAAINKSLTSLGQVRQIYQITFLFFLNSHTQAQTPILARYFTEATKSDASPPIAVVGQVHTLREKKRHSLSQNAGSSVHKWLNFDHTSLGSM